MEWCKYVEFNHSAKQQYLCMDIRRASMQFQDGCGPWSNLTKGNDPK